ncbi:RBBP9/YdeN family alpha/beta hydrolase [Streptomyces antimycoticus]|uniref:RBBP9/YdeN family alpha/beta hydrolase n=1 Tax=Streptomyces antimycoticus TaxID=68175 RepID=UPI002570C188|nr:alpha/beta hydrolase [Streptomyces antimycoticus]WJD94598.1 alpha/beta hydrolase [Streptomyces antimycoticus]
MSITPSPTVVIVPGLRDHVPDHWQTILADKLGDARTVPPLESGRLSRDTQVAALEGALSDIGGPVVLIAHSAGVLTTVHWAQRHHRPILSALLAAPPDFDTPLPEGYPTLEALRENGWTQTPRTPLPFPSIVAASTNDPLATFESVTDLARAWGSRLVDVGPVGHLNPAAGYGEWPRAEEFVRELGRVPPDKTVWRMTAPPSGSLLPPRGREPSVRPRPWRRS